LTPRVVAIPPRDKLRRPNRVLIKIINITIKLLVIIIRNRLKGRIITRSSYIGHWFLLLMGHKTNHGKYDYSAKQAGTSIDSTYDESISIMYQKDYMYNLSYK